MGSARRVYFILWVVHCRVVGGELPRHCVFCCFTYVIRTLWYCNGSVRSKLRLLHWGFLEHCGSSQVVEHTCNQSPTPFLVTDFPLCQAVHCILLTPMFLSLPPEYLLSAGSAAQSVNSSTKPEWTKQLPKTQPLKERVPQQKTIENSDSWRQMNMILYLKLYNH